jgi:peptidoglycan/LPS O-acetylase OafA/YrhL
MFGAFRPFLAILVVANHLWEPVANKLGFHAVIAFYVISGLLMTKIIHEVYGTDRRGVQAFLINRMLRVFPAYWLFVALTLAFVWLFNDRFAVTSYIQWPETPVDWARNLTLIDLAWGKSILIPPAWCLGIEVLFYILMPVVLARSSTTIWLWFVVSCLIAAYLIWTRADFGYRYYPAYAASLFISLGAVIYECRQHLSRWRLPVGILVPAVALFGAMPLLVEATGLDPLWIGYYGAGLLMVPILGTLMHLDQPSWARLDRFMGDLAFPAFMVHFVAGGIVLLMMPNSWPSHGLAFFGLSVIATLVISVAFVLIAEPPLQRVRDRVRRMSSGRLPAAAIA